MALKSRKVFSAFQTVVIVLSMASPLSAQTPRARIELREVRQQEPQQTDEEKNAAKELEKKALALIDEMVAEAATLRLAENRVHILTGASELLWERDEERARAIAREAMNQVVAQMRESREKAAQEDGQYFDSRYPRRSGTPYLRQTVLGLLARRDARLAMEFLQLTRSLRPNGGGRDLGEEQQEKMMELSLASQIAENDPQTALKVAEEYLDGDLDYQAVNLWSILQRKDPKAASALTEKIISSVKSQDLLSDYNASGFVFNVLSVLRSRAIEIDNARNNPDPANAPQVNPAEIQQAYRDVLEAVASATLKITVNGMINPDEANRARNLIMQVPNYLPDIEKFLPSRIAAVRAKVAQFDKARFTNPYEKFYAEYGSDLHNKSLQELLTLAPKAPEEARQNVYYQAVNKAIDQGDDETARKIVKENIPDKWQANELLSNIERRNSERAIGEGKYADARKALARMGTDEQRASTLAGWASAAAGRGDEKSARELLEEARALIGSRMQRSDELEAQLAVAAAAVNLDPNLSFEIADAAIERINRLIAANQEIQTFSGMEEGETRIAEGGGWGGHSGSIVPLFTTLAHKDFDRAANLLKHWQSSELRLMMSLSLAQNILGGQGIAYGFGSRGSVGNGRPLLLRRLAPAAPVRR
ncbi:MAG TPA: hypothetical protein VFS27_02965 [Blastocatellia bacterium]|jgi:hypothetical protein|nr:hypothetical protein [Blastocatellia bacterium]